MERAYAQALWNMVSRGGDHAHAVTALAETLKRTGRSNLMRKILPAFERIAARESKRDMTIISVGRKADAGLAMSAAGVTESDVILDPTLIGGYRLERGDVLIDASWKKHLITLYNAVTA